MSRAPHRFLRFWRNIPAEVDDELRFHLESRIQEYVASGMSPHDARVAALRRFGNVERVRAACESIDHQLDRERKRADMFDTFRQDLRYALRALRRNPGFTFVAVLTLALGIGANTAIFSVVNAVLLRPLPYREPDRLVRLFTAFRGQGVERYSMSQPEFLDYKGLTSVFENAAAFGGTALTLTGRGEPERVRGVSATRDFLPVLGIAPARGRNFEGDEGRTGTEPVVILTHEYWQTRFGGDERLLGQSVTFNGISRRVVGILPPGAGYDRAQVIVPLYVPPDTLTNRGSNFLDGVARLRPGVTLEQARRALEERTRKSIAQYPNAYPAGMGYGATVITMRDELTGDVRPALLLLLGGVGLVLLIACANVANLLLARGETRGREIAVRIALGAGRGRVMRQLLTESTLLALLGAAVGTMLAWWALHLLIAGVGDTLPRAADVRIDLTVGAVTLLVAVGTGVLFGLAPALQLTRPELHSALKEGARGAAAQHRLGRLLVVAETALAVIVVVGASLLVRSFTALRAVDPGFTASGVLVVDLALPAARYDSTGTLAFYRDLLGRLGAFPGVRGTAAVSEMPPAADGNNFDMEILGRARAPGEAAPSPNVRYATVDYFRTMEIAVRRGRGFGPEDRRGSAPVAVINESAAHAIWGDTDPVGQQIRFDARRPWISIVGVVEDTRSDGLGRPTPAELFLVHEQTPALLGGAPRTMYVLARTAGDPLALAAPARSAVRELDPLLAITSVRDLSGIVHDSVARERLTTTLLGAFGIVALLLAAVGLYGLMSYNVKRRTRELGIRMALGAGERDILRLVLRQGMRLAVVGLAAGIVSALGLSRFIERLLFGVRATDVATYVAVSIVLVGVALLATWVPARRAVLTAPSEALRAD